MDTVTYPDARVAQFVVRHFLPVKLSVKENQRLVEDHTHQGNESAIRKSSDEDRVVWLSQIIRPLSASTAIDGWQAPFAVC